MPKRPALTSRKVLQLLKNHGFVVDHQTGSHLVLRHPNDGRRVVVPIHSKDLPKGTLHAILKQAQIRTN